MQKYLARTLTILAAASVLASPAIAQQKGNTELPKVMSWTAYGVGTSAHSQAVAIGNMLRTELDVSVRILPGRNDVSRMTPLVTDRAQLCSCGASLYLAQEGLALFSGKAWGPQPARTVMMSFAPAGFMLATQNDRKIKSLADLKGKRVSYIKGGVAQNSITGAYLYAAQMTWDDVKKVEFSSYVASVDGLSNGQVDAVIALSVSPIVRKLAASPGSVVWIPLPHNDGVAWKRFLTKVPYFVKTKARIGAGIPKGTTVDSAMYPYPILASLEGRLPAAHAYALTHAMVKYYDTFKNNAPGAKGWSIRAQKFSWVLPFHPGAVRYFKEIGKWSDSAQANNDALIARQGVLGKAWKGFKSAHSDLESKEFSKQWLNARKTALTAANMPLSVTPK